MWCSLQSTNILSIGHTILGVTALKEAGSETCLNRKVFAVTYNELLRTINLPLNMNQLMMSHYTKGSDFFLSFAPEAIHQTQKN